MNNTAKTQRFLKLLVATALCLALACLAAYYAFSDKRAPRESPPVAFMEGDIIFQITDSFQSGAIQLATGSKYTHCGVLFNKDGAMQVYEAVKTVRWTPLDAWIARGVDGHYVLMRLKKDAGRLDAGKLAAMKKAGEAMAGKPYDLLFQWSDDKLYCSELVWKIYERGAGISLAPLRSFRDYHLDGVLVRAVIKERYGGSLNLDEKAVAPSDLMESELLETIADN